MSADERTPAEILDDASTTLAELDSFHIFVELIVSTSQGNSSIEFPIIIEADYQKPLNSKGVMKMDIGFISFNVEFLSKDGEFYMTDPETGEWIQSADVSEFLLVNPSEFSDIESLVGTQFSEGSHEMTLEGIETVDGIDTYRITTSTDNSDVTMLEEMDGELDIVFFVGVEDGILHRLSAQGSFESPNTGGAPSDSFFGGLGGGDTNFEMNIEYSEFNTPVEIEPPDDFIDLSSKFPGFKEKAQEPGETEVAQITLGSGWTMSVLPTHGLAISTPPSWLTVPLGPESIGSALEAIETSGDSISHMIADQLEQRPETREFSLYSFEQEPPLEDSFHPNMSLVVNSSGVPSSLDDYVNSNIQQLEKFWGVTDIDRQDISLASGKSVKLEYTFPLPVSGDPIDAAITQYVISQCSVSVLVTFTASEEYTEQFDPLFTQIADTVEILDTRERICS